MDIFIVRRPVLRNHYTQRSEAFCLLSTICWIGRFFSSYSVYKAKPHSQINFEITQMHTLFIRIVRRRLMERSTKYTQS